jgi:alkanesulfonate monooxygenase SsuD/methylene tetrahydromethanopterin reductase-like flavin-dependent oxidoreductase (luciferase family)
VQIGVNLPVMAPGLDRDGMLAWSRAIDAGPFASLALGERICFPNPEMLVTASAAAAVTERVRIVLNVLVLPMHAEVLAAKQAATLDVLSGGRLVVGVGVGGREEDYRAVGAAWTPAPLARLERQVGRMRAAWRGEAVVDGALRPVEPAPVQPGGPPVWAGSLHPQSIRRAARWADGLCSFSFSTAAPELHTAFEAARTAWREQGRAQPPRLVTGAWFALGPDAASRMATYLGRYLNFLGRGADAVIRLVPSTSPAALRAALRRMADAGADEVLLVPTTTDLDELRRLEDVVG